MTRIDRIRTMSTEEMAKTINEHNITDAFCRSDCCCGDCKHEVECCIRWLEEEV